MLFVIDVGNTSTVLGVYDGAELIENWRVQTHDGRTADEHGILLRQLFEVTSLDPSAIEAAVMSCVVPPMEPTLLETAREYFDRDLLIVGRDLQPSMPIQVDTPSEVGADRLVNAVGAWRDEPVAQIVVDFGTATTFDVISADGAYTGGAIAPGITASSEALFERASKLPRVEFAPPDSVIGKTTIESIQSGLTYGYIGLVREIIERMTREIGGIERVIATGGLAERVAGSMDIVDMIDDDLTLSGLRWIYKQSWVEET